jgi:HAMP domain-containing protein
VKLRWQLVLSHLASMLVYAVLLGIVSLAVLLGNVRSTERDNLENSATTASGVLLRRFDELHEARNTLAAMIPSLGPLRDDVPTLARLHELIALYRIERLEVFRGLQQEVSAYRWERGANPGLSTVWLPSNPRVAAQVASGRDAVWVQSDATHPPSLKLCRLIPGGAAGERRWVVITEPLDGVLLGAVLPSQFVGALEDSEGHVLVAWPHALRGSGARLEQLAPPLPSSLLRAMLPSVVAHRAVVQLDDGTTLSLGLLTTPLRGAAVIQEALRASFLLMALALIAAFALGSGVASRLLAPLRALLNGTGAMARGHLMVRLPTNRRDELGSLMVEFNRMADELRNTYLGVISTLAEVVEAKSHYTREHIERVERLTMATADVLERRGWLRLSSHQRFLLSVAAILHDVGKIAIDNEILNKSGPLDGTEREQILAHTEVGALIVERMGKLERAADVIRCAHEHFDGSGYPNGLKGEEIPLEARIILAVDAFDAMTMDRPYSEGRPIDEAIAELRSEAGRQFDPVVVEALIEVVTTQRQLAEPPPTRDSGLYRALHAHSDPALLPVRHRPVRQP